MPLRQLKQKINISQRVFNWLSIAPTILLVLGAIGYCGFSVNTPASYQKLEKEWHDSTSKMIGQLEQKVDDNNDMLNDILRGDCTESTRANLIRQGLIRKCEELGIVK